MKIALAFWGLTRSLKYTVDSINEKILDIFKKNNIEYKIFMHTWIVNSVYNNKRTNEKNVELDNNEYKLLEPDYFETHEQDEFKKNINFKAFRTHKDPWNTNYESVDNFICAMFSKSRCTKLIENSNEKFDYVIFLRPDCLYLTEFDLSFLKIVNNKTICIPNFALYGLGKNKFNDRFAITNNATYKLYGDVFSRLFKYSKKYPLHSETFYFNTMKQRKIYTKLINFIFRIVRSNGIIWKT